MGQWKRHLPFLLGPSLSSAEMCLGSQGVKSETIAPSQGQTPNDEYQVSQSAWLILMCQDGAEKLGGRYKGFFGWKTTLAIWISFWSWWGYRSKRSPGTCSKFRTRKCHTRWQICRGWLKKTEVVGRWPLLKSGHKWNEPIDFTCWKECSKAPHWLHRTRGTCATWMRRKTVVENAAVRGISWGNSAVKIAQHFWNLSCSCFSTRLALPQLHFEIITEQLYRSQNEIICFTYIYMLPSCKSEVVLEDWHLNILLS